MARRKPCTNEDIYEKLGHVTALVERTLSTLDDHIKKDDVRFTVTDTAVQKLKEQITKVMTTASVLGIIGGVFWNVLIFLKDLLIPHR